MSRNRGGRGLPHNGILPQGFSARPPFPPMMFDPNYPPPQAMLYPPQQRTRQAPPTHGGVRPRGNGSQPTVARGGGGQRQASANNRQPFMDNNRRSMSAAQATASSPTVDKKSTQSSSSLPYIGYKMLTEMLTKEPDVLLGEMLKPYFQFPTFLNDDRMRTKFDWLSTMTILLERIVGCVGARERISMILVQLPGTSYLEGIYEEVRKRDPKTDQLRFDFIRSFLKVADRLLAIMPHAEGDLSKILERLELMFTKLDANLPEVQKTKSILDEVLERASAIDQRRQYQEQQKQAAQTTNSARPIPYEVGPPPDDYRVLPIVPSVTEILSEQQSYLRRNIVDGVYEDARHYLDVHFRLLREDFIVPLREGIQQYLSGAEGKNFNVRIYEDVRFLGSRLCRRSGLVYDLRLNPEMVAKISWANSRRLMFGNLLVLTFDQFQSCAFGMVEDRSEIEKNFIISVRVHGLRNNNDPTQFDLDDIDMSHPLTMIETMTYFEAYRPVLQALQSIEADHTFPLAPYLLKLTSDITPPDYVVPETRYDFTPLLVPPGSKVKARVIITETPLPPRERRLGAQFRGNTIVKEFRIAYEQAKQVPSKYRSISLLDKNQWPTSEELHLNPKQRDALFLALTNKVALIQGPPGTGKTFLGVRIAEMLMHNRPVWCPSGEQTTPILMICHTNHALDQFLELIKIRLDMQEGIIRVGNRCQNEAIRPFSLLNARKFVRENRSIPSHIYHQKHLIFDRKQESEEALREHSTNMDRARTNIVRLLSLVDCEIIADEHLRSLLAPYGQAVIDAALFDWLGLGQGPQVQQTDDYLEMLTAEAAMATMTVADDKQTEKEDEEDKKSETIVATDQQQEINEEEEEEQRRRDEIELDNEYFIPTAVPKPQIFYNNEMSQQTTNDDDDGENPWQIKQMSSYNRQRLIKHIIQNPTTFNDQTIQTINNDLWQLTTAQRHDVYRYWLSKYLQYCHYSVRDAREEYNRASAAHAEYLQEEDYFILKDSVIVAMTTTCAAKYHTVLEKLESKIVIVEEAAAIFEAHIITALSTKCEHLILIGDHVQLRPNPSVYRLGTKFNIDVSLFERLVKNKFPNVRLNIQHRMRPEIARLMKHFYDDLQDHESVLTNRPAVRGIENNIFFITHTNDETTVADGSSKRNEFEANYTIALATYLIKQGYRSEQITILVMYLGQRQFIAKRTKPIKLLHGVRIMVTDNYQGEENDIIILSLVRSNKDNSIGFLKIHNRICVALSRARCGFFVIGNMNMLAKQDEMWQKIVKSLFDQNELGRGLSLSCRLHPKDRFLADTPASFLKRPEGGCSKPCNARLKCGHQCELFCHNYDFEHKDSVCRKKCNEPLENCDHRCTKRCHADMPNQHDPCRVLVEKQIKECGHKIRFQCARIPTNNDCQQPVLTRLDCDHVVDVPCCDRVSPSKLKRFPCPKSCETMLSCKHKCAGTCGKCHTGQVHIPCQQKCERPLVCSHVCKAPCALNCPPCLQKCETRCVHSCCQSKCGQLCVPCKEPCDYKCKHLQCTRLCSEPCDRGPCNQSCDKKLKCGHGCIGICGEPCPEQCRTCNKHVVQEIFFGSEDEPDARFVFLPDCKHLIEVTALDKFIFGAIENQQENKDRAVRFPECPKCKQPIRRCTRYMSIINRVHGWIESIKAKTLGNVSERELTKQRKTLITECERLLGTIQEINSRHIINMLDPLNDPNCFFTQNILALMKNTVNFFKQIDQLLVEGKKKLLGSHVFDELVSPPLHHIVNYMIEHRRHNNFADQQTSDFQAELDRIDRLIFIQVLLQTLKLERPVRVLKTEEKATLNEMQMLTTKTGPFTMGDRQKFDSLVERIKNLLNLPGLGITERERVAIVGALNLTQGHWFICPNGHPYVITECGGASQESQCPECGQKIGGQNHQLLSTNRHFGLMDGSNHAAWSNEVNLAMIPHFP